MDAEAFLNSDAPPAPAADNRPANTDADALVDAIVKKSKFNRGVFQPSQSSSGFPEGIASPLNPDWDLTTSTRGGVGGLIGEGLENLSNKVIEPVAAKVLNTLAEAGADDIGFSPDKDEEFKAGQPIIDSEFAKKKGVLPAIARAAQGFTTPGNLLTLPFAAESKALQTGFLVQAASQMPDQMAALVQAQTPDEIKDAATSLGISVVMAGLMKKGLDRPEAKPLNESLKNGTYKPADFPTPEAPITPKPQQSADDFLNENPKEQTKPENSVPSVEGFLQGDQGRPGAGTGQPSDVRPDDTKPATLQPALLVNGKPVTGGASHKSIFEGILKNQDASKDTKADTAESMLDDSKHVFVDQDGKVYDRTQAAAAFDKMKGNQPGTTKLLHSEMLTDPAAANKPKLEGPLQLMNSIHDMSQDDFYNFTRSVTGGLTGEAYRIGQNITKPEELQGLKDMQAKMAVQSKAMLDKGDIEGAMTPVMKGQMYREAYEAATGTGSGGEALQKQLGDKYKPPFPIKEAQEADPDWQVTIQAPQALDEKTTVPGYVQIDDVTGGVNHWSKGPEKLKGEGFDVPDFSKLPAGKYTFRQASEKLQSQTFAEKAANLAGRLDSLKSGIASGGQLHAFGVAADLWDRAVGVAQAVIRAGGSVADAVSAAISHIKDNHSGDFDEKGASQAFTDSLSKESKEPVYGIAQRVREDRANAGQVVPIEPGAGIGAEASVRHGENLLNSGADPEVAIRNFEQTKKISLDDISLVRARGRQLAKMAEDARQRYGQKSEQYEIAWHLLSDWDSRTKPMQTEWHKIGMAQQGETGIETGSFTSLRRAYKDANGTDFTPEQEVEADRIAKENTEATDKLEKSRQKLYETLDAETESKEPAAKPETVEPHVRLIADKLKSYFETRASSALERIKQRRSEGRLFTGIDPSDLIDYADYGASKILKMGLDAEKISEDWAKSMIEDLGDYIKPHLETIWTASKKAFLDGFKKNVDTGPVSKKVKRAISDDASTATKKALDAANKAVRDNASRVAEAENAARIAGVDIQKSQADARAASESTVHGESAVREARNAASKAAAEETKARVDKQAKASEPTEQEKLSKQVAERAAQRGREISQAASKKAQKTESKPADVSDIQKKAAEDALKSARKRLEQTIDDRRKAASKAAEDENKRRVKEAEINSRGIPGSLDELRKMMFGRKPGEPFTTEQVKAMWGYAKRTYIDKGITDFDEIRNKMATDIGIPVEDVTKALGQPKGVKKLTDEMYRNQQNARRLQDQAKQWIDKGNRPGWEKAIRSVPSILFGMKVGFHGTVALGTHAPMVAFQPQFWKSYVENFFRMYKMVLKPAFYEQQAQDLVRRPNYVMAKRAGLVNDPFKVEDFNNPEMLKYLHNFVTAPGNRGYFVLKILRQDMFDQQWSQLPETAQVDDVAKAIADGVNHATGVVKSQTFPSASLALFAPRLEFSRVAWLAVDPVKALASVANWNNATQAEKIFAMNQFKEKATVFGVLGSMLALNQGLLSAMGSNQQINFTNPMKSDFLKFKVGGMTVSYGNAMLSMARLPIRLYSIRTSDGGKLKNLIYPDEDTYSVLGEYGRSQLSPFASLATDLWFKSDWQNRPLPNSNRPVPKRLAAQGIKPYTWPEFWSEQLLPIPFEEGLKDVWQGGLKMSPDQAAQYRKALATVAVMAATGARMEDDNTVKKPKPEMVLHE